MKRIVLLISFLAVAALCASAQTYVDFRSMPIMSTPSLMPSYYPEQDGLAWDNFYYVTPGLWRGAGAGFWLDPATQHNTVAFIGGPLCTLPVPCTGVVKLAFAPMLPVVRTFAPISITASAGWLPNRVVVTAYNNGKFVGTLFWELTTKPQTFTFPAAWNVTQLAFAPDTIQSNTIYPNAGSMVVYSFIYMH